MARFTNYSRNHETEENFNSNEKYSETGESVFSRESTIPFDQSEVLSERHYTFQSLEQHGKQRNRSREPKSDPHTNSYRGRGPKGHRRTDSMIKDEVSEALYRHWNVDASEIEVSVSAGVVTLKGWVETKEQKRIAEDAVENLAGVEGVYNELHVRIKDRPATSRFGLTNNITGPN